MPFARDVSHGSLIKIPDRAVALADAGRLRGRQWSLAEICEHLLLAVKSTVAGASLEGNAWRSEAPWPRRMKRWWLKHGTLRTGFIPFGIEAPSIVQPRKGLELDEAIEQLRVAASDFEDLFQTPGVSWSDHSILGPMSGPMWRRFHHVHAAHHFNCVETSNVVMASAP
ncbi:MAG: DUF1569 domain-containing protein [Phycisphaerae bacterium]